MTMKLLHTFEPQETVVGMVTYRDHIYIATTGRIYRVSEDVKGEASIELVRLREYMGDRNSDTKDALADYDEGHTL